MGIQATAEDVEVDVEHHSHDEDGTADHERQVDAYLITEDHNASLGSDNLDVEELGNDKGQ